MTFVEHCFYQSYDQSFIRLNLWLEGEIVLSFLINNGIDVNLQMIGVQTIRCHAELVVPRPRSLSSTYVAYESCTEVDASHAKSFLLKVALSLLLI